MVRSPNGWKEVGLDMSPPRPAPSERTRREMLAGRKAVYGNNLRAVCRNVPKPDLTMMEDWADGFMEEGK